MRRSLRPAVLPLMAVAIVLVILLPSSVQAIDTAPPAWVGQVSTTGSLSASTVQALSNPASTQEELPGLGHKFELFFAMHDDQDPVNVTNDVISVLTTTDYPPGSASPFATFRLGSRSPR